MKQRAKKRRHAPPTLCQTIRHGPYTNWSLASGLTCIPYSALAYPNFYYIYATQIPVSVSVRILVHKPQRACVHAFNSLLRIKNDPQRFSSSDMHRNCDSSKGVTELLFLCLPLFPLSYKPQRACVHVRACMHAFNFLSRIKNDPTKIQKD